MKCHEFETRMEALLEGDLDQETQEECLRHARVCLACSEILEAVGGLSTRRTEDPSPSLTAGVLERTIGSACEQARGHLPAHVDRELDSVDFELVDLHVESCPACQRLAATLVAMRRELPRLAEIPIDDQFTSQVMAATLPRQSKAKSWWLRHWSLWIQRPRFAMEAAYVGVLVVMLILGAFSTPLAALPQKGLEWVQPAPDSPSVWTQTSQGMGTFWEWVASLFEKAENEPTEESS